MKKIDVSFKNENGQDLKGILELPSDSLPQNFAIFAHCFTCNKNFHAPVNISRSLASRGYGVLRFDFTGLGESEGKFENTNFSSNVEDLIAAADFLKKEYSAPSLLIGHSLGGAAILFAASKIPSIKAMVTINAPSSLSHVKNHFSDDLNKIKEQGYARVKIGGRNFKITSEFVNDLEKNEDEGLLKNIRKPLLIMHSPQDKIVSIDHAEKLYRNFRHPKSFISLDGSDHMLSLSEDSVYAGNMIAAWAEKYIPFPEAEMIDSEHQVVANLGNQGFTTQLNMGKHRLIADEPESFGGENLGPNPYEFVSGGLAACTSMTIQMYARRKEWSLENVETHVSYSKEHAEDCQNCEQENTKLDTFRREIIFHGTLDEKQIEKLLLIADKCPVHKTLSSKVQIITSHKAS